MEIHNPQTSGMPGHSRDPRALPARDDAEDVGGLLRRHHERRAEQGRPVAGPAAESSTSVDRATLGTWIGQRSLPARG